MPTHFDLIITVDAPSHTAEFRLLDVHGSQLAYRHTDFKTISLSHRQGCSSCGITSRKPLAALAGGAGYPVRLGPLADLLAELQVATASHWLAWPVL